MSVFAGFPDRYRRSALLGLLLVVTAGAAVGLSRGAAANNLPADLIPGPFKGILQAGIDPLLQKPIRLTDDEFRDLVDFVRDGLFDSRVLDFCDRVPDSVPSGMSLQLFEGCR